MTVQPSRKISRKGQGINATFNLRLFSLQYLDIASWGTRGPDAINPRPRRWLLERSPVMLPIPGALAVAHLEENVVGAALMLTADEIPKLDALA